LLLLKRSEGVMSLRAFFSYLATEVDVAYVKGS